MFSTPISPVDKITIGLYGLEGKVLTAVGELSKFFADEAGNIMQIANKFTKARRDYKSNLQLDEEQEVPSLKIVVSVLLIPNWEQGSNYENSTVERRSFIRKFQEKLGPLIGVEDFYEMSYAQEKGYLQGLSSRGSCADMIKSHAIIANSDIRHLQMDSNTKIPSFKTFYAATFSALAPSSGVMLMLNAGAYGTGYVAAMNKVVFTFPRSKFAAHLKTVHLKYCQEHAHELGEEKTKRNSIYSQVFAKALCDLGITVKHEKTITRQDQQPITVTTFNMANIADKALTGTFGITSLMITAVNQSWQPNMEDLNENDPYKILQTNYKDFSILVGDAFFDLAAFKTTLKKYTEPFNIQAPSDETENMLYQSLLAISSNRLERSAIKQYVLELNQRLAADAVNEIITQQNAHDIITVVANIIPKTARGQELTRELFRCPINELPQYLLKDFSENFDLKLTEKEKYLSELKSDPETYRFNN